MSLAIDNEMPIVVFDMTQPGNIVRAVHGEPSDHLRSGRNLNVYVSPSGLIVQDSAAPGMTRLRASSVVRPTFRS